MHISHDASAELPAPPLCPARLRKFGLPKLGSSAYRCQHFSAHRFSIDSSSLDLCKPHCSKLVSSFLDDALNSLKAARKSKKRDSCSLYSPVVIRHARRFSFPTMHGPSMLENRASSIKRLLAHVPLLLDVCMTFPCLLRFH